MHLGCTALQRVGLTRHHLTASVIAEAPLEVEPTAKLVPSSRDGLQGLPSVSKKKQQIAARLLIEKLLPSYLSSATFID